MSTYQGQCGNCDASGCWPSPVLPLQTEKFGGSDRKEFVATATVYGHTLSIVQAGGKPRFTSATDYLRYKKGQVAAGSASGYRPYRAPPAPIADMIAAGCPCSLVSITNFSVNGFESGGTYDLKWPVTWTPIPGTTASFTVSQIPGNSTGITEFTYTITGAGSADVFANLSGCCDDVLITMTLTGACGTETTSGPAGVCFLAGAQVTLADGSVKAIEEIAVGDHILGAFGETNEVLALHRPLLGANRMCCINGDHHTSNHHPHVGAGREFYSNDVEWLRGATYGREHEVINAAGEQEMRMLHGLRGDRVQMLTIGVELKTVEGSRAVRSIDVYELPPTTQLYNLVVGGSHTFFVDGYAVTGWPREDDFNYDMWSPK